MRGIEDDSEKYVSQPPQVSPGSLPEFPTGKMELASCPGKNFHEGSDRADPGAESATDQERSCNDSDEQDEIDSRRGAEKGPVAKIKPERFETPAGTPAFEVERSLAE